MTNKIEVINPSISFKYIGSSRLNLTSIDSNDYIEIKTGLRTVWIDLDQAKELAEILPEFIKKIEEEK